MVPIIQYLINIMTHESSHASTQAKLTQTRKNEAAKWKCLNDDPFRDDCWEYQPLYTPISAFNPEMDTECKSSDEIKLIKQDLSVFHIHGQISNPKHLNNLLDFERLNIKGHLLSAYLFCQIQWHVKTLGWPTENGSERKPDPNPAIGSELPVCFRPGRQVRNRFSNLTWQTGSD